MKKSILIAVIAINSLLPLKADEGQKPKRNWESGDVMLLVPITFFWPVTLISQIACLVSNKECEVRKFYSSDFKKEIIEYEQTGVKNLWLEEAIRIGMSLNPSLSEEDVLALYLEASI